MRLALRAPLSAAACLLVVAVHAPPLTAQEPKPALVRVRVVDTAGMPMADVQVFFLRDERAIRVCNSDAGGRCAFSFPVENAAYAVTARRLGFLPAEVGLRAAPGHADSVALTMRPAPAELDTVRARADNELAKEYTLGAADIAAADRPVRDALEALRKLRPFMLGDTWRTCPTLQHVWVDGERVWDQPSMVPAPPRPGAPRGMRYLEPAGEPDTVVLFYIKSEHIREMRYVNCWDTSNSRVGTDNALFITLKPGVDWDLKRGSYVTDSAVYLAGLAAEQTAPAPATSPSAGATSSAAPASAPDLSAVLDAPKPMRIVGVYDADSGEPIGGVQVRDSVTGVTATTTKTGTAVLTLLRPPTAVLVFHKDGFVDQRLRVVVSPADTMPLTVVLPHHPKL